MPGTEERAWARLVLILAARITIGTACVGVLWTIVPLPFGWTSVVVVSGSMGPRIKMGDVAVASPVTGAQIVPGQPVLADNPVRPGKLLLHRVIRRNADGTLVTKGDANPAEDSTPLAPEAVHALPRLLVRYIGLPVYWHGIGENGKLALTGLAAVVLGFLASRRTDDEDEDEDETAPAPPNGETEADRTSPSPTGETETD